MLNIIGKVKVTNLKEISEKMLVGSIISFEKVGEEFKPTFLNAKFVGEAVKTIMDNGIMDKDNIEIHSGVLSTREYKNKDGEMVSQLQATIFKLEPVKEEKKPQNNKSKFKK